MTDLIINGKAYEIPPMRAGQVRKNWPALVALITSLDAGDDRSKLEGIGPLTGAKIQLLLGALQTEYPELTEDDLDTLYLPEIDEGIVGLLLATRLGKGKREPAPTEGLSL